MSEKIKRFCIVCEIPLRSSISLKDDNEMEMELSTPPDDGVYLKTCGNWGSTVYDTFGRAYLEMNICDKCLVEKAKKGLIYEVLKNPVKVELWDGEHSLEKDYERTEKEEKDLSLLVEKLKKENRA